MKNVNTVMILFALVLLLATMETDGQSFNRPEPKLLSDDQQATTSSSLGRKATEASLVAANNSDEDGDEDNPTFGKYGRDNSNSKDTGSHRAYINGNNPYAPKPKKSPRFASSRLRN
ncbi:hypothetical protein DITRI_Ditri15bG0136300 [Diplodiscus trichospermus]